MVSVQARCSTRNVKTWVMVHGALSHMIMRHDSLGSGLYSIFPVLSFGQAIVIFTRISCLSMLLLILGCIICHSWDVSLIIQIQRLFPQYFIIISSLKKSIKLFHGFIYFLAPVRWGYYWSTLAVKRRQIVLSGWIIIDFFHISLGDLNTDALIPIMSQSSRDS